MLATPLPDEHILYFNASKIQRYNHYSIRMLTMTHVTAKTTYSGDCGNFYLKGYLRTGMRFKCSRTQYMLQLITCEHKLWAL